MSEQSENQWLQQKLSLYSVYMECDNRWISTVVIHKNYAVTAFHRIPDSFRQIGSSVILTDIHGRHHDAHVHGVNKFSNYVMFKKTTGVFDNVPDWVYPTPLDQYIVMGFSSKEKQLSVRRGQILSLSPGCEGVFYGDSDKPTHSSGGGLFYARNGAILGIARESDQEGQGMKQCSDVLEMVSIQAIIGHIEFFKDQSFSVG